MTVDIKVGDKVAVDMDSPTSSFHGVEGTVEEITPGKNHGYIRVTKTNRSVEAHTPVGRRTYLYNLTKVGEDKVAFKPGDKIVFVEEHGHWATVGDTAVVTKRGVQRSFGHEYVHYKLDKNHTLGDCFPRRVKLAPTFGFKDIQVGDKVRRTETWESGSVKSVEGVVVNLSSTQATTKEGLIVGYYRDANNPHMVLELLEKAKPKPPELWENRKAGDKIATYSTRDGSLERLLTKREDGLWDTLVMNTIGALQKGFERSDEEVALHITKHSNAAKAHIVK